MNFLNKNLFSVLAVASLLPLGIQSAQATSEYSNFVEFNVEVTGLSNLTSTGDFSDISYDWMPFANDYSEVFPAGDASHGSSYTSMHNVPPFSVLGAFSQSFAASGAANNGELGAYYESSSELWFYNDSATDTFQIDLQIDYILSASAESDLGSINDLADSDVFLEFKNENGSFFGDNSAYASAFEPTLSEASDTLTLTMLLEPGDFDVIYTFAAISGTLQSEASPLAPVPVPAAIWFFGSAILSLAGMRKLGKAV